MIALRQGLVKNRKPKGVNLNILTKKRPNMSRINKSYSSLSRDPANEPIFEYRKGSPERIALQEEIQRIRSEPPIEIPMIIGGKEIKSDEIGKIRIPHQHEKVIATYHRANNKELVDYSINESLKARKTWAKVSQE